MRIAALMLSALLVCAGHFGAHSSQGAKLEVKLSERAHRSSYRLKDSIALDIQISNSGDEPLGVFAKLGMGYQGGIILHVLDATGAEVHTPVLEHDFLDDRAIADPGNYFLLQPRHFFGTTQEFAVNELVRKPGHYSLLVEYHCPVDSRAAKVRNFWGIERRSIVSSRVPLDVH